VRKGRTRAAEDGGFAARLGTLILARPRAFVALVMAGLATGWIFANALLLQHGPHPAPFFAAPTKLTAQALQPNAAPLPPARPVSAQPVSATRALPPVRANDPIAALLAPSPRMLAMQQALTEFGYGPVAPTGVYDPQTRAAIMRFEEGRGLPADGQASERVLHELAKVAGRPI
jgi:hypothetical protein